VHAESTQFLAQLVRRSFPSGFHYNPTLNASDEGETPLVTVTFKPDF
jgi:hypothetical protein